MKTYSLNLMVATLAFVASTSVVGCGEDQVVAPVDQALDTDTELTDAINLSTGQATFRKVVSLCLTCMSLSDAVALTPYLDGGRKVEDATLAETVELSPIVAKFQTVFIARMSELSAGEAVRMVEYMNASGKNQYPYPNVGKVGEGNS